MGRYSPSGTPGVPWRSLDSYAAGESLLISSGDRISKSRWKTDTSRYVHYTPNHRRIEEIEDLLTQATISRSQSALKDLVMLRDGGNCLLTTAPFFPPNEVLARCAHINPFSIHSKTQTLAAIEMFAGSALYAQTIHDNINHPRNALNLQSDAHDSMDKHLAWGIEAISSGGQYKYYY